MMRLQLSSQTYCPIGRIKSLANFWGVP